MRLLRSRHLVIRSGGQTGVDRAALDCAVAKSIPYVGWCPRGGWAEDFAAPPGLLERYPRLTETPSPAPAQRTAWNVRDSAATLIIVGSEGLDVSPGTKLAVTCAETFERPCYVADLASPDACRDAAAWLARLLESTQRAVGHSLVLNVAGPRESESPGIYLAARAFINQALEDTS